MDHITNDTSLIGPCDVIPVGAQNPRFPVVGHRTEVLLHGRLGSIHPGFESTMKTLNHVGGLGLVESFLVLVVKLTDRYSASARSNP